MRSGRGAAWYVHDAGDNFRERFTSIHSCMTRTRRHFSLLAGLLAAAACSAESPGSRDSLGTPIVRDTARPGIAPGPAAGSGSTELVVRPNALGPLRVGMTRADARRALGLAPGKAASRDEPCVYLPADSAKFPAFVMVEHDTLVRFDVRDSTLRTEAGARIGDTEAKVLELYRGRVTVEPHKYTGPEGHYLVVATPGDSTLRIVFETDGRKVTTFRAGRRPQVDYIEGCS